MFKRHHSVKVVFLCTLIAVSFTACTSLPNRTDNKMDAKILEAWKGEWVSIDTVKDAPELVAAYQEAAANLQHYTVDGVKAAIADTYSSPVIKAVFDGSATVILTVLNSEGKEIRRACTYRSLGKVPVAGSNDRFWETFQAVEDIPELREAKNFIARVPHGETSPHWHGKFSSHSIDWLVNGKQNSPTYVPAATAREAMIKSFEKGIKSRAKSLPEAPFSQYAEHGKWINRPYLYDDSSKETAAAYDTLIKEFAGKNPKGGDFTKEEIIAEMKKGDATVQDFAYAEFVVENGKNELVLYSKDNTEVFRSAYKRIAQNKTRPYITMRAEKKNAGKYSLISFVVVHGAPSYHFHLWYGENEDALAAQKGTPTCYKLDVDAAVRAKAIEKSCRRKLTALTKSDKHDHSHGHSHSHDHGHDH